MLTNLLVIATPQKLWQISHMPRTSNPTTIRQSVHLFTHFSPTLRCTWCASGWVCTPSSESVVFRRFGCRATPQHRNLNVSVCLHAPKTKIHLPIPLSKLLVCHIGCWCMWCGFTWCWCIMGRGGGACCWLMENLLDGTTGSFVLDLATKFGTRALNPQ